jgi:hypothetical protein
MRISSIIGRLNKTENIRSCKKVDSSKKAALDSAERRLVN